MGLCMEITDTFVTNPSGNAATAVFSGDTLQIRDFKPPAKAWMIGFWGSAATVGTLDVRSPRLHDNVKGLFFRHGVASTARDLFTEYDAQMLYPQDTLIVETNTGGTETDGASFLTLYEDLPGSSARLVDLDSILPRIVNLVNVEVQVTSGAAVGSRATARALNADVDLLIANTDYALLGYEVDAVGLSVGIKGPDTSNFRVGGPMTTERIETRDWFVRLNRRLHKPTIPVINSANKGGTLIDNAQVVTGIACKTTLVMAQLSP